MNTKDPDKILVVDDTAANLQLLTNLLTQHGHTVFPASDGELALEFVRATLPHLILLDIRMPGMDGFEVCRRLKADERTRAIPVIFISILEDEGDKVKGFRAGAVDYITKPFQAEEVLARVRIHLRLQKLNDRLDQKVRERTDSTKKMSLLIDDLLSFSRMGRNAMSIRPLELEPLVRDVIAELESDAAGRVIDWRIGDLPAVEGDASLLRIVLINLISNALKFTRPRQEAHIEIGSLPRRNGEAVIYLRDNGVGFDMAYKDKLFGVFQRLHRADEFEGTGIGLASVRRIIARHGGRTWAEGGPEQGAAFFFSLPHPSMKEGK